MNRHWLDPLGVLNRAERLRQLALHPVSSRGLLWSRLPLAAFAGLTVERLDEAQCAVALPAGWRTQNPFHSIYFAAQAMAAEMSTGLPVLWSIERSGEPIASLVTELSARFTRKATQETLFTCGDGLALREAIGRAAVSQEPALCTATSRGVQRDGTPVADFTITWSFKRRAGR